MPVHYTGGMEPVSYGGTHGSTGHDGSSLNLGSDRPRSEFAAQSLVGATLL